MKWLVAAGRQIKSGALGIGFYFFLFLAGRCRCGFAGFNALEFKVVFVSDVDFDKVFALEFISEHCLRERVFDVVFDGSSQRSCAKFGIIAFLEKEFLGSVGKLELQTVLNYPFKYFVQLVSNDCLQTSFESGLKTITSSIRLRNSGLKWRSTSLCRSSFIFSYEASAVRLPKPKPA